MGGYGTLMLAARHPDLFTAASSLSGSVDTNLPANASVLSASPALQGAAPDSIYGPRATQEIRWRGHNPWDLAENLRDVDLQVRTANGEPRPQDLASPADLPGCPVERAVFDASVSLHNRLGDLGVAHSFTNYGPGCHIASTFEKEITDSLPAFERAFAHPREVPRRFTYRSIEPHFEVWGWTVDADPDRPLEFLRMQDAGRTGLTLSGSGTTQVTTPPWFHGLRAVDVGKEVVQPDPDGRLSFSVDLSPSADVAFAPHARIRITRAGPRRVCARAIGGTVTRARARVRDATGQTMARTSRATLTRRARCLTLRLTRPLGRRPYTLVVHGRDAFGHRVRATRRR
jgi:hypothetical protein